MVAPMLNCPVTKRYLLAPHGSDTKRCMSFSFYKEHTKTNVILDLYIELPGYFPFWNTTIFRMSETIYISNNPSISIYRNVLEETLSTHFCFFVLLSLSMLWAALLNLVLQFSIFGVGR